MSEKNDNPTRACGDTVYNGFRQGGDWGHPGRHRARTCHFPFWASIPYGMMLF